MPFDVCPLVLEFIVRQLAVVQVLNGVAFAAVGTFASGPPLKLDLVVTVLDTDLFALIRSRIGVVLLISRD